MIFTTSEFDALDENKLKVFLRAGINEFFYLDYKQQIEYNDYFKGEFLKDISAFANAYGGNLIYGVKEPVKDLSIDDQVVGLENAIELLKNFEKLAQAGLDPRIPGLKIKAINIENKPPVLVTHVPQSISKPHMITYKCDKKWLFYKRGTESNLPMNTQQIRSSVLKTYNNEERIMNSLKERESLFKENKYRNNTTFFFQAIPMLSISPAGLLNEDQVRQVFHENKRHRPDYEIRNNNSFSPSMKGIKAVRSLSHYVHSCEVHHNGYIESILELTLDKEAPYHRVDYRMANYFKSILSLTDDLIVDLKLDSPYSINCKIFNSKQLRKYNGFRDNYSEYEYPTMKFSTIVKNLNTSVLDSTYNIWIREFYNAFGSYPPPDLLKVD